MPVLAGGGQRRPASRVLDRDDLLLVGVEVDEVLAEQFLGTLELVTQRAGGSACSRRAPGAEGS